MLTFVSLNKGSYSQCPTPPPSDFSPIKKNHWLFQWIFPLPLQVTKIRNCLYWLKDQTYRSDISFDYIFSSSAMCKVTLLNHRREGLKRWISKKEKGNYIWKWSYNNNFSEESCINWVLLTFKNTLVLWLLLWTSKISNSNSFVPGCSTHFKLHICIETIIPLRGKQLRNIA